jgi:hypothetical protein
MVFIERFLEGDIVAVLPSAWNAITAMLAVLDRATLWILRRFRKGQQER